MVGIDSREKLRAWLNDRPPEWSAAIALRIALRIMPIISNPAYYKYDQLRPTLTIMSLRCAAISWVACNIPTHGIADAAYAASNAARAALAAYRGDPSYSAFAVVADAARAVHAAYLADTLYATYAAADAARVAYVPLVDAADLWRAIDNDCDWVAGPETGAEQARSLLATPLWHGGAPDWFEGEWAIARKALSGTGDKFGLWRDWFQRRIDGEAIGFDLPADADAELSRRLIAADDEWWKRPPAEVNADIKAWLAELTPPMEPDEADFTQNPRALMFGADDEGRIGLAPDLAANRLLNDADAQDRHAELLREARAALAASSRDLSQAFAIGDTITEYLDALGDSIESIRPSPLVLRGDKLRRLRADYLSPTSSKPPLSEDQAFALENWERAHSALVGIDPFLSSIERASYGPTVPVTIITLDAIKAIIDSARKDNIATESAHTAITDSVENVPTEAPATERRYRFASESLKNFIRGTADFIRKYKESIVVVGAGGLTKAAYEAALWIQRNLEWLRDLFAGEQSILDLINWIASLPL